MFYYKCTFNIEYIVFYIVSFLLLKVMGLNQSDILSPLLFNIVLEKIIRRMQETSTERIYINIIYIEVVSFVDDLNIIGKYK